MHDQQHHEQMRGLQAALGAFGSWGLLTVYWHQLKHLDAFELIGWRVVSASVLLVAVCLLRGRLGTVLTALRHPPTLWRVALATLLLSSNWTMYVWSVGHDRIVETALGYFLAPLGTIAIGTRLFGERLTPLQRVSIGCTAAAVVILTISYGAFPWVAVLLAATWSAYGLIKRGITLEPTDSLAAEVLLILVPAGGFALSGFFRAGTLPGEASAVDWVLVSGTGLITAIPLVLFAYAAKRVPFTILGPANYLVPLINFVLGWLAYHEPMPTSRFVGFGFVWLALGLVTFDTVRRDRSARRRAAGVTRARPQAGERVGPSPSPSSVGGADPAAPVGGAR